MSGLLLRSRAANSRWESEAQTVRPISVSRRAVEYCLISLLCRRYSKTSCPAFLSNCRSCRKTTSSPPWSWYVLCTRRIFITLTFSPAIRDHCRAESATGGSWVAGRALLQEAEPTHLQPAHLLLQAGSVPSSASA